MTGVATYAQGSSDSRSRIRTSESIDAGRTLARANAPTSEISPAIDAAADKSDQTDQVDQATPAPSASSTSRPTSAQIQDPKFVEQILASLEYQTGRANDLEKRVVEWKEVATEYKGLYLSQKDASALALSAGQDRKDASTERMRAIGVYEVQHREDKETINQCFDRVAKLEKSRLVFTLASFGVGYGTRALQEKFQRQQFPAFNQLFASNTNPGARLTIGN